MKRTSSLKPLPSHSVCKGTVAFCVAASAIAWSATAKAAAAPAYEPARAVAASFNEGDASRSRAAPGPAENGYQTLYRFTGGADGEAPFDTVVLDSKTGSLYGTTLVGGANKDGTIFELSPPAQKNEPWTETVLYSFTGGSDGEQPQSFPHLIIYKGNIYGTASLGGASGLGTVFELASDGTFTTLYSFKGGTDGAMPYSGVIADSKGNLYGTTGEGGGTGCDGTGCGTVWKLTAHGAESVLHSFGIKKNDGQAPQNGLLRDGNGNLFGTTLAGGAAGAGTVFEVKADGSEKVLHSFQGANDGAQPYDYLIEDKAGNIYGTTSGGGLNYPGGTAFKLTPRSKNYKETLIYAFQGGQTDGSSPNGLIMDSQGNLYGTNTYGGGYGCGGSGCGGVFELSPPAGKGRQGEFWTETVLTFFPGEPDGANPYESVVSDGKGTLYGTTSSGGEGSCYNGVGCGTVYKLEQ